MTSTEEYTLMADGRPVATIDPDPRPSIYEALGRAVADVEAVAKDQRNVEARFGSRSIDDVLDAVHAACSRHGVFAIPWLESITHTDVTSAKGNPLRQADVVMVYRFHGPRGDYIDARVPGESIDAADKSTSKALQMAYKYALIQTFCLPINGPDADTENPERGETSDEPTQVAIATITELAAGLDADGVEAFRRWAEGHGITPRMATKDGRRWLIGYTRTQAPEVEAALRMLTAPQTPETDPPPPGAPLVPEEPSEAQDGAPRGLAEEMAATRQARAAQVAQESGVPGPN